jgi:hypothetical protein
MNTIKSIPTSYAGINFRSRLEAKWAAFFDLCGWKWSYEPEGFDGWIPDFSLGELPTLVEVKPFLREEEWKSCIEKIVASGCKHNVVLLGSDATFFLDDKNQETPMIGWLVECYSNPWEPTSFDIFDLNFGYTEGNDKLGLCPMGGGWTNYIWDVPKNIYLDHPNKWCRVYEDSDGKASRYLRAAWSQACNVTQWRMT